MYDDANPENIATTNLTITVRRNENAPRFDRGEYVANVLEIAPIGTQLVELEASDRDADDLQFYVMPDTDERYEDYFYLNPFTGVVSLARPLSLIDAEELTVSSFRFSHCPFCHTNTGTTVVLLKICAIHFIVWSFSLFPSIPV